jgi:Osmosensitive K+ channel His kinase sensor domain
MLVASRMRAGGARSDSRGMQGESFQPDGQSGRLLREPRRDETIVSRAPARPAPLADRRARIQGNQLRRVYEPGEPAVMSQAPARSGRPSSQPSASSAGRAVPRGWRRNLGDHPETAVIRMRWALSPRRGRRSVRGVSAHRRPPGRSWVIPPAEVPYRDAMVEEMDLGAVLARRPQVALVDDLVHTNAPDAHHAYPWQDVEDLLAAGIEVISTVSIGHLASVADVVAKTTGAAPRRPARSRSSARQARSSWWVRRRRFCASGWPAATSTRPRMRRRRWAAGTRPGTCQFEVSRTCADYRPRRASRALRAGRECPNAP